MSVNTTNESVCIDELIAKKDETRQIEGDMIVPDIKPDILSIIRTSSNICVYKKEILDGKLRIDGTLQVYIIYVADDSDGSIRSLSTSLDFTETIQIQELSCDMNALVNTSIRNIEARLINGRKINISASICFEIKIYSDKNIEIIKQVDGIEDIQTLDKDVTIYSLIGKEIANAYAKETVKIDPADNLAEIFNVDVDLSNIDTKISYNKVLVKADTNIKLLYSTDDNRINSCETTIPVMGFANIPNVLENHVCKADMMLKNLIIKPNNEEEHSVYVEAEYEVICRAYERKDVKIIEDLYSPKIDLCIEKREATLIGNDDFIENTYTLKERVADSGFIQAKMCYTWAKANIISQSIINEKIDYECELKLGLLYYENGENNLKSKEITLPFQTSLNIPVGSDTAMINTKLYITNYNVVIMPDGALDITANINIQACFTETKNVPIINEITANDEEYKKNCSMVIYFIKKGDTLWNIAKEHGSTMDEIIKINDIENPDNIQIGKQLFIPKHCKRKIA